MISHKQKLILLIKSKGVCSIEFRSCKYCPLINIEIKCNTNTVYLEALKIYYTHGYSQKDLFDNIL